MGQNILITGGAGFMGSHLADKLVDQGHRVVAIDNLSLGREENIAHHFGNQNFSFIKGDVLDASLLKRVFDETPFDTVYHFAANSDRMGAYRNPVLDLKGTFLTTQAVLEEMRLHDVKQLVFASSSAIYGNAHGIEVNETYGPLFPVSHYGAAKLASEALIASYCENYGIQAFILRYAGVCGERCTHGALHDFVKKLKRKPHELEVLGNGKQRNPYLYVKDAIDATLFVVEHSHEQINFFNVGVEGNTSVERIAEMVIASMKLEAKIRYTGGDRGWIGDVPLFRYDLEKIHQLGWKASLSSDEAVQKAIDYILQVDWDRL